MKNLFCFKLIKRINTLCILFNILLGMPAAAQFDLQYQSGVGDNGIFRAVAADGLGNTIAAGRVYDTVFLNPFVVTNPYAHISFNSFVGKFNSVTNIWQWAKQITIIGTGSGSQFYPFSANINDVAMDNEGNSYITGDYTGTVKFDNISLSSTKSGSTYTMDIFVAKLNANGNFVWAKSLGSKNGVDYTNKIIVDPALNLYVTGVYTNKTLTCGGQQVGITDVYLAKLNSTGNTVYEKRYASSVLTCVNAANQGSDLCLDASGNICLAGTFSGTMSFGSGSGLSISSLAGSKDAFVAKINAAGTTLWVKSNGTTYYDNGNAVISDASGSILLGGEHGSSSPGESFVTRYQSNGTILWTTSPFTEPLQNIYANSISRMIVLNGDVLVEDKKFGFKTLNITDGTVLTSDSLVGNGNNVAGGTNTGNFSITDLAASGNGFIFSLRGTCGYVSIGDLTLQTQNDCPASSQNDLFLVTKGTQPPPPQFDSPISQNLYANASPGLEIYPNPVSDVLHINFPKSEKGIELFIQNQLGHTVWSEKFESQTKTATISLNGQHFQSGIYYLILIADGEVQTRRLVVDK